MKKGIFVGSFNPVTLAHELIANDLLNNKILDYIYYLPVNSNKTDLVSIDNRIKMIELIKNKKEEVLNIYNYSKNGLLNYDVLKEIDLNITHIILGSDLFFKFNTFTNYKTIIDKYYLVVINRDINTKKYIEDNYKEYLDKIIFIDKTYSGSSRKAKLLLKKTYNKYLNQKVLDYIKENNLYN